MIHYQQGNAIRLSAEFTDWSGEPVDPDVIKFMLYDLNFKKLNEWTMGANNRSRMGNYFYDYVPEQCGTYFYEWYGEIDGLPSLQRDKLEIRRV